MFYRNVPNGGIHTDLPDVTNTTENASSALPVFTSSTTAASGTSTTVIAVSTGPSVSTMHPDTGAIVGGVLGGVLGLLLLIAVAVYIFRRPRRQIATDKSDPDSSQNVPVREISTSETSNSPLLRAEGGSIIKLTGFYVRSYDSGSWSVEPADAPSLRHL